MRWLISKAKKDSRSGKKRPVEATWNAAAKPASTPENGKAETPGTRPSETPGTGISETATLGSSAPDDALITAIAGGDRLAFEALYHRYYRRLFGFVSRWIDIPEAAEEVVDDVLFIVWRDAAKFERRSSVSTWIFGIAYHRTRSSMRLNRTHTALDEIPEPAFEDRSLRQIELRASLGEALETLPPEQRAVLQLTFFEGCSYQEIADILDCPVNTVKTRMFHARRKLRQTLPRMGWAAHSAGG